METFPYVPAPGDDDLSRLRQEALGIKQNSHELHENHKSDPQGNLVVETFTTPKDWLEFIASADEVLQLDADEAERLRWLVEQLLRDEITDDELEELIAIRNRFDLARQREAARAH